MQVPDRFSPEVVAKAQKLVDDKVIRQDSDIPTVYHVKNYTVQVHEGGLTTCTCPNGLNRAISNCYHSAAALMVVPEEYMGEVEDDEEAYTDWEVIE